MATITPTSDQLKALVSADLEGPIQMVNLLKFKPGDGAASYARYAKGVIPFLKQVGGKVIFRASGHLTVIGSDDWDEVIVVEYPSKKAFLTMTSNPEYLKIASIRASALADSRLYCTQSNQSIVKEKSDGL